MHTHAALNGTIFSKLLQVRQVPKANCGNCCGRHFCRLDVL